MKKLTCGRQSANPSEHVTQGFSPIMPTYQGQISEDGVISLVEYIKNLNSNDRVEQTREHNYFAAGRRR